MRHTIDIPAYSVMLEWSIWISLVDADVEAVRTTRGKDDVRACESLTHIQGLICVHRWGVIADKVQKPRPFRGELAIGPTLDYSLCLVRINANSILQPGFRTCNVLQQDPHYYRIKQHHFKANVLSCSTAIV